MLEKKKIQMEKTFGLEKQLTELTKDLNFKK